MVTNDIQRSGVFSTEEIEAMCMLFQAGSQPDETEAGRRRRAADIIMRFEALREHGNAGPASTAPV